MHVCLIAHEYPKPGFPHGGVGSFLKTLAPKLVENGFKVTVIGVSYTNTYEHVDDKGVSVYRLNYTRIKGLTWFFIARVINKKIAEINKLSPIDVIETSELDLAFITKLKNVKHIIRMHGGHHFFAESENRNIKFWKGFQEKRSFKKADAFIPVSNYVKEHTEKLLNFQNKPIQLINLPIDIKLFSPIQNQIKKFSIVFVGSVCEKKGVRQLIQSFPLVKEKFPEATLQLYGRDWFFPDGKSYIKMLRETELPKLGKLQNDIFFHGNVEYVDMPKTYSNAHVCVFPSHMETQGLVAPEAMAMGKIVIFTNKGPGPETIIEFENGLLCDPFDPENIAEKINWVFNNDEKVPLISKNARETVLKKFSTSIIVQKNIDFYNKIINK